MPIRMKHRPALADEPRRSSPYPLQNASNIAEAPVIGDNDSFRQVLKKLSIFITNVIVIPSTFEQLRTTAAGDCIRFLVDHLSATCKNPAIVNALLALKWHYNNGPDPTGLNESRGWACEIIAWRFLTRLSEPDVVNFCLYEIPSLEEEAEAHKQYRDSRRSDDDVEHRAAPAAEDANRTARAVSRKRQQQQHDQDQEHDDATSETDALLPNAGRAYVAIAFDAPPGGSSNNYSNNNMPQFVDRWTAAVAEADTKSDQQLRHGVGNGNSNSSDDEEEEEEAEEEEENNKAGGSGDPTAPFIGLNALEIAAIANSKRFLSQHVVQNIITAIWNGRIIFWDQLTATARKKPCYYDRTVADPFSRLRVPKYLKTCDVVFFLVFLTLYYVVLVEESTFHINVSEWLLYIWLVAFACHEFTEWVDAGSMFYIADVWNNFDIVMLGIGVVFAVMRIVGLYTHQEELINTAFDILSLEALFMVPRIFSILSLSPYWGTLIPCLSAMTKDFLKFMVLVVVIYVGFLTTFSLISRDVFSLGEMTMILTKIFFGSTYVGFEVMGSISELFGPPLMLIFITFSTFLLMGSLTGMLSNSFSAVITHAREEYLYVYSVYVLEASTSNRLTHFYPPFNLLSIAVFRPLRLLMPYSRSPNSAMDARFRSARIALLKATHLPIVAAIEAYEFAERRVASARRSRLERLGKPHEVGRPHLRLRPPPAGVVAGSRLISKRYLNRDGPLARKDVFQVRTRPGDEDDGDMPSNMEVRINDINQKIDKLTELVESLRTEKTKD